MVDGDRIGRAVRRLLSDFKEIKRHPLRSVTAEPLENDLFEWHCNLTVPTGFSSPYQYSVYILHYLIYYFRGIVFHMVLQFPPTYPFQPPTLYFCSKISHAHVFGSWVCMDMLVEGVSVTLLAFLSYFLGMGKILRTT